MFKGLLFLVLLFSSCTHIFGAARDEAEFFDRGLFEVPSHDDTFLVSFVNRTQTDMQVIFARTDALKAVIPTQTVSVSEGDSALIRINCVHIMLTFPKIKRMLEVRLDLDVENAGLLSRQNLPAGRLLILSHENNPEKVLLVSEIKAVSGSSVERSQVKLQKLLDPDAIRNLMVDRCKAVLPSSERLYLLGQHKYLRRSVE